MYRRLVIAVLCLSAGFVAVVPPVTAAATNADSTRLTARYDVSATINYAAGTMAVKSTATVTNTTSGPVNLIVFNLATLRTGHAVIGSVSAQQQAALSSVSDQSVVVELPYPMVPGASTGVTILYSAAFSTLAADKNWLFAKQSGTLTAYRWIPWLSLPETFDRPNFGSPFVTGVSPHVNLLIRSDVPLRYATSGRQTSVSADGLTRTFAADNVRDFNFAADPNFATLEGWSGTTKIVVLTRTLSASSLLSWAQRAIADYVAKVGPYRYPMLTVAETPTGTSMESPAMVWITADSAGTNLPYRVAHEIAHEWFYAMIGSNQATEPFADEALADFMARRLLGTFRSSKCADAPLYDTIWDYSANCYYEVVYVQGANYLNAYRAKVGGTAFWAGLRAYYNQYLFGIGGTRQFWNAMDGATGWRLGHADRFPSLY